MRSKIKTIVPEMNGAVQKSYTGTHGTMYTFLVTLENGTVGQVSSKSPAPHRFVPGDEVEFTYTAPNNPAHTGRLKIEKPKDDGAAPANGDAPRSGGWSPAKEASVMIQGLLKSVIESGATSDRWPELLAVAVKTHDAALRARIAAKSGTPVPAPQAAPTPVAKPEPVAAGMDDDDLPF